jgi:hypothetical protein
MIYVNKTGKHIGECLTGFGSSYPVTVYNSGNSDVEYKITVENNTDIFNLSTSEFIVNNGSTGKFDIFYKPEITASTAIDSTEITIFSQSVEDGSVDPSGLITLEITGSRIISNTAGAVRRFVALKNYDIINGISYDFMWYPPTGTGNLKNYYFTGYRLDIATSTDFVADTVFTTEIIQAQNTTNNPKFATFYGYPELENKLNISTNEFAGLDLEVDYYARIYTFSTNNTGISIYATGIESISEQLSNDVINGNSGTKLNIRFDKKPLNVYVPNGNYTNYSLNTKIIEANNNSNDLLFYSGINIYLPSQSTFQSSDENNYALNLNNQIFKNFTGDPSTFINLYVPYSCRIVGNFGKGGDILTSNVYDGQTNVVNYVDKIITDTTTEYNKTNPTLTDSKSGGSVLNFDAKTESDRTDFIYNIYAEKNSFIAAGGGGNKAGIIYFEGVYYGVSSDNLIKDRVYPLNGAYNKFGQNTKYNIFYGQAQAMRQNNNDRSQTVLLASIFSNASGYGEVGSDGFYLNPISNRDNSYSKQNGYYYSPRFVFVGANSFGNPTSWKSVFDPAFIRMPGNLSVAGNIVKKYSNSSLRYSFYNTDIPSDYIFRFSNNDITNSPSWAAKNYNGSTIFTLNTVGAESGTINQTNDFNSTGYKALTFSNKSLAGTISFSSETCKNFDLFIVGCFGGTLTAPKNFSLINWYSNSQNISSNHVSYRAFLPTFINTYPKESNIFNFFTSLLYNHKITNTDNFFLFNPEASNSYYQLSKSLSTSSFVVYPFVLNIKRNGTSYSIYINGELHTFYDLNFITPSQEQNITKFLSSIQNTTFRLENSDSAMTTTFFDILFYNRVLFDDENRKVNNSLLQSYIKLFTGETANNYLTISNQIRMPNVFNLAGTISSIP